MIVLIPYEALANILQWIFQEEGGVVFHLGNSSSGFNANTKWIDFTESTYSTYAPFTATPGASRPNPPGQDAVQGPVPFGFPTPASSDSIGEIDGFYATAELEAGGAPALVCIGAFDAPVVLPNDTITLLFGLTFTAAQLGQPPVDHFEMIGPSPSIPCDLFYSNAFELTVNAVDLNGFPVAGYNGSVSFSSAGGARGDATLGAPFAGPPPPVMDYIDGNVNTNTMAYAAPPAGPENDTITCTDGVISGVLVVLLTTT